MYQVRRLVFSITLLSALILMGCQVQPVETYYRGYKSVNESARPLVQGESQVGQWQTFDMLVDYKAQIGPDDLAISGTAKLGQYYLMNTIRLKNLDVYLFFLDKDSKVLKTVELSDGLTSLPEEVVAFNQRVKLPDAATAFAFGYRGAAYQEADGEDGDSKSVGGGVDIFDNLPHRDG